MGREGSWWILLGSLSWMGLLLAPLEAWSRSRSGTRGRSLGGGRRIVLKLLLLRLLLLRLRLLLLRLLRARLRGPGLWAVSCREREQWRESIYVTLLHNTAATY